MQEILNLIVTEHVLMAELWEDIDQNDTKISDSYKKDLNEKLTRYQDGETTFYSWDDIQ